MRVIVLLAVISASLGAPQVAPDASLDLLIASIYGNGSQLTAPSTATQAPVTSYPSIFEDYCECVPFYECLNNTIREGVQGSDPIDNRDLSKSCGNYLDICCRIAPPPSVPTPEVKMTPKPEVRQGCGKRNRNGIGSRIAGGPDSETQFGEFPWMVAIFLKNEVMGTKFEVLIYQCGGALIHPRAVLTAAHCVNGYKTQAGQFKIRAGEWDSQTKNELYAHQDRDVDSIVVHKKYNSGALYNDIAILILKTPVQLAENVNTVCLPKANENFDGTRCFASGWGQDKFGEEVYDLGILKKVELPIVPHDVCQNSLRRTRLGKDFVLNSTFICAGGEPGKDTCSGDGGSPLVCPLKSDPSRYVQVGIVSWGIGCGEDRVPGVYANVAALRPWICEMMRGSAYGGHQPYCEPE